MSRPPTILEAPGRVIGRVVEWHDELDSTNREGSERSGPGWHGRVIIARHQTAGRGQYGRSWLSRPGSSLLLSIILEPADWHRPVLLTAWATLGVARTVQKFVGITPRVKWPNDVYVGDKKVCGILSERGRNWVVGIGLNLRQTRQEFDRAALPHAASLASLGGVGVDEGQVLDRLLDHLEALYSELDPNAETRSSGDRAQDEWVERLDLLGRPVRLVEMRGDSWDGRVRRLSFTAVEFETADGVGMSLSPSEIRRLSPLGADGRPFDPDSA